ncbi:MAG: hypothetical protein KBD52_00035 [Candidatus Pacebacteria bacterium]|nr:hypothetical protein [Candidatus Paceibacterota bacterium]
MNLIMLVIARLFGVSNRQSYHVGWLAKEKTLEDLRFFLHKEWGFGGQFKANIDNGEVLSWRKLEDNNRQYHLRIYEDGEIRGHFEVIPEHKPISHFLRIGQRDTKKDFVNFLGDFIVDNKNVSNLVLDPEAFSPPAEILPKE